MIEIQKVTDKKGLKAFINFRTELYRNCEFAVPYLYIDEEATLRKDRNASFECCEADYFLAIKDGKIAGRVAAIINRRSNEQWNTKDVRFGWFDFINDIEVSKALMQTVEAWGAERGMTHVVGPLGFTDMDREGMLVEGFGEEAAMYTNYNYPYYVDHMARLGGFAKDNDYVECEIRIPDEVPDKIEQISRMIERRYNLHVRKLSRRELMKEGYGRRIFEMVNETYKDLYGYSHLSPRQIDQLVSSYIKVADLNLVTVVEDRNEDKFVGFGITFPSFSKALKQSGGRLLPFGWINMLKTIKYHNTDKVDLLLVGVLPQYRDKGANALIIRDLIHWYRKYGFKWAETMQQMETNTKVLSQWQYFDARVNKRHRCFRKALGAG